MKANLFHRAIETRFLGPTNFRGSRIQVRWADKDGARKVYSWNSEWDSNRNHEEAAMRFYNEIADTRAGEELHRRRIRLEGGWTERGAVFCIRYTKARKR